MKFSFREIAGIMQLLLIRGTGMVSLFLVNIVIARNFGAATQGLYQIGLGWVIVMSTIFRLGQDQLMLRTAAECKAQNDFDMINRKLNASLVLGLAALVVGTAVALLLIRFNVLKVESGEGREFLSLMVFAILPTGVLMIVTETIRGWQNAMRAMVWQGSVPQTLVMLLLLLAVLITPQITSLFIAGIYVAVFAGSALCAWLTWRHICVCTFDLPRLSDVSVMIDKGWHFWIYSVLNSIISWIDILILGWVATPETVGHYFAVVRTGAVLGHIVQITSAGAVARLALYYAQMEYANFANLFRLYFRFFGICALPLAAILLMFPDKIMSVWGSHYESDTQLFLVYGGFQILNFIFSITGLTVVVMGLEQKLVFNQMGILAFKIFAIAMSYHFFGLPGVVWASGVSLFLTNLFVMQLFFGKLLDKGIGWRKLL